jgi:hypothetical protein
VADSVAGSVAGLVAESVDSLVLEAKEEDLSPLVRSWQVPSAMSAPLDAG